MNPLNAISVAIVDTISTHKRTHGTDKMIRNPRQNKIENRGEQNLFSVCCCQMRPDDDVNAQGVIGWNGWEIIRKWNYILINNLVIGLILPPHHFYANRGDCLLQAFKLPTAK